MPIRGLVLIVGYVSHLLACRPGSRSCVERVALRDHRRRLHQRHRPPSRGLRCSGRQSQGRLRHCTCVVATQRQLLRAAHGQPGILWARIAARSSNGRNQVQHNLRLHLRPSPRSRITRPHGRRSSPKGLPRLPMQLGDLLLHLRCQQLLQRPPADRRSFHRHRLHHGHLHRRVGAGLGKRGSRAAFPKVVGKAIGRPPSSHLKQPQQP